MVTDKSHRTTRTPT